MKLSDLFESPQNDIDAGQMASNAFNLFISYIKQNEYDFIVKHPHAFVYNTKRMGFDKYFGIDDLCIFVSCKTINGISGYANTLENTWYGFNHVLGLECMDDFDSNKIYKSINNVQVLNTFKHEFIHILDFKRIKGKKSINFYDKEDGTKLDTIKYYNDSHEFNAYYHEIADNLIMASKELDSPYGNENSQDVLETYGITGNFLEDIMSMISSNRGTLQFIQYLTRQNEKKLLKRLYKLYAHVCARADINIH